MVAPLNLSVPGDIFLAGTFHYRPDPTGNGIEAVEFLVFALFMAGLNVWFTKRTGNQAKYMWLIPTVGLMESLGYYMRIYTTQSLNLTSYITATCLILVAPILLAGVNYVVVGKLLQASGKSMLCIKPRYATRFFVLADVLCFVVQCGAAGLLVQKNQAMQDTGTDTVLFGLGMQLVFFTGYGIIAGYLAFSKEFAMFKTPELRAVFKGLFFTSVCIYIRNIFRFVEFASGRNSQIVKYELVFFGFETIPIDIACFFYCLYHFGRLLPADADLPGVLAKGGASQPKVETETEKDMAGVEVQQLA